RGPVPERPAGRGQYELADVGRPGALQTLEDRAVLAVDRDEFADPLPQRIQDERPADDERFLVREREPLPRPQRGQRGLQPGGADDRVQDDVHLGVRRGLEQPGPAVTPLGRRPAGGLAVRRLFDQDREVRPETSDLRLEFPRTTMGRERDHPETVRVPAQDRERAPADRSRRTQYRDPEPHDAPPPCVARSTTRDQYPTGSA